MAVAAAARHQANTLSSLESANAAFVARMPRGILLTTSWETMRATPLSSSAHFNAVSDTTPSGLRTAARDAYLLPRHPPHLYLPQKRAGRKEQSLGRPTRILRCVLQLPLPLPNVAYQYPLPRLLLGAPHLASPCLRHLRERAARMRRRACLVTLRQQTCNLQLQLRT